MPWKWGELKTALESGEKEIWVTFHRGESTLAGRGLAVIADGKATIVHLTTLTTSDFPIACTLFARYLTSNPRITQLLFPIKHNNHEKSDGTSKLQANEQVQKYLKQVGFKWKSLTNKEDGTRETIFAFKQVAAEEAPTEVAPLPIARLNTAQLFNATVNCKHIVMISDEPFKSSGLDLSSFLINRHELIRWNTR